MKTFDPSRLAVAKPLADWAAQIQTAFAQGRANTLALAQVVCAAKRGLRFGQWTQLWRSGQLPFSKRKGEMLVVIGHGLAGLDANNCAHLPTAWRTLYYLAQLDQPLLIKLIAEGVVHSALTIQQARALVARHASAVKPRASSRSPLERRLARFRQYVQDTLGTWTPGERETARTILGQLIHEIGSHQEPAARRAARAAGLARPALDAGSPAFARSGRPGVPRELSPLTLTRL